MDQATLEKLLKEGGGMLGVHLDRGALSRLSTYLAELSRWNRRINLVSRESTEEDWAERHFLDSLVPLGMGLVTGDDRWVLDLGAGAGFPGLPLQMASPGRNLLLAEADARKCSFLRHAIRATGIMGTEVLQGRFEDLLLPPARKEWPALLEVDSRGGFDLVVSRAAAPPGEIRALAKSFLRAGGRALLWVSAVPRETGGKVHPYRLPLSRREGILWEVGKEEG